MNKDHFVFLPAFLVLFASFLAFHAPELLIPSETQTVSSYQSAVSVTGMVVVADTAGECLNNDSSVVYLYQENNSHVAMIGAATYNPSQIYCAQLSASASVMNPNRSCTGANPLFYVADELGSSAPVENAHFYAPETNSSLLPASAVPVCYESVICETVPTSTGCAAGWECLLSFEGPNGAIDNAHVGACGFYANTLCCQQNVSAPPPPTTASCPIGTQLCTNGQCSDTSGSCANQGGPAGCNGAPDGVCDADEGCGCSDCDGEQDSCAAGLVCTQVAGSSESLCLPTGLVTPGSCTQALASSGSSFSWSQTSVGRGATVQLDLTIANNNCDGSTFAVTIYDANQLTTTSVVTPLPITVSGGSGSTTWVAENNEEDPITWQAQAALGGSLSSLLVTNNQLTVSPGTPGSSSGSCGDGILQTGEQCDDNNNDNGDGCSSECLIEGSGGTGYAEDCDTFCVSGTALCVDVGHIAFCGDYNGDGCREYNEPGISCPSGEVCNNDFGACVAPTCSVSISQGSNPSCGGGSSIVCGAWSSCSANGRMTRTCTVCSAGACSETPIEEMFCSVEPAVKGPAMGLVGFLVALSLICLYYVKRKN